MPPSGVTLVVSVQVVPAGAATWDCGAFAGESEVLLQPVRAISDTAPNIRNLFILTPVFTINWP